MGLRPLFYFTSSPHSTHISITTKPCLHSLTPESTSALLKFISCVMVNSCSFFMCMFCPLKIRFSKGIFFVFWLVLSWFFNQKQRQNQSLKWGCSPVMVFRPKTPARESGSKQVGLTAPHPFFFTWPRRGH